MDEKTVKIISLIEHNLTSTVIHTFWIRSTLNMYLDLNFTEVYEGKYGLFHLSHRAKQAKPSRA